MSYPKLFIECPQCRGSGFAGRGTGYDDVCPECGGLKFMPIGALELDRVPWPKEPPVLGPNYVAGLWSRRNYEAMIEDFKAVPR